MYFPSFAIAAYAPASSKGEMPSVRPPSESAASALSETMPASVSRLSTSEVMPRLFSRKSNDVSIPILSSVRAAGMLSERAIAVLTETAPENLPFEFLGVHVLPSERVKVVGTSSNTEPDL